MVWPCTTDQSCTKSITNFQLPDTRKEGRPCQTWSECVKTDGDKCGLASVDPIDRDAWRADVRHSLVLPTPLNGTVCWSTHQRKKKLRFTGLCELIHWWPVDAHYKGPVRRKTFPFPAAIMLIYYTCCVSGLIVVWLTRQLDSSVKFQAWIVITSTWNDGI